MSILLKLLNPKHSVSIIVLCTIALPGIALAARDCTQFYGAQYDYGRVARDARNFSPELSPLNQMYPLKIAAVDAATSGNPAFVDVTLTTATPNHSVKLIDLYKSTIGFSSSGEHFIASHAPSIFNVVVYDKNLSPVPVISNYGRTLSIRDISRDGSVVLDGGDIYIKDKKGTYTQLTLKSTSFTTRSNSGFIPLEIISESIVVFKAAIKQNNKVVVVKRVVNIVKDTVLHEETMTHTESRSY